MHDLAVLQAQCPVEVEVRRRNPLVFAQTSRSRREICRSLGPLGAATLKLPGPSAYHPSYRRSTVRSVDSTIRARRGIAARERATGIHGLHAAWTNSRCCAPT